jgi:hypothetical protein
VRSHLAQRGASAELLWAQLDAQGARSHFPQEF